MKLYGKAETLAKEYEALYAKHHEPGEWASSDDYTRVCAIEDEMESYGYIRDRGKWIEKGNRTDDSHSL